KRMKKLIYVAMIAMGLSIFNACQKSDELIRQPADEQQLDAVKPDVYVENGYLAFKTKAIYDSIRSEVENYSIEERLVWEKSLGFTSAKTERYMQKKN
ncbi:MAG: hypothetical protein JXP36_01520, partial [Bacteroidales bacterium]|nr:hypothetical protein [Bacteroidales bacterium]